MTGSGWGTRSCSSGETLNSPTISNPEEEAALPATRASTAPSLEVHGTGSGARGRAARGGGSGGGRARRAEAPTEGEEEAALPDTGLRKVWREMKIECLRGSVI